MPKTTLEIHAEALALRGRLSSLLSDVNGAGLGDVVERDAYALAAAADNLIGSLRVKLSAAELERAGLTPEASAALAAGLAEVDRFAIFVKPGPRSAEEHSIAYFGGPAVHGDVHSVACSCPKCERRNK